MLDILLAALEPEPHPDLVAVQQPTAREFLMAVSLMGWLPEERWEPPVSA